MGFKGLKPEKAVLKNVAGKLIERDAAASEGFAVDSLVEFTVYPDVSFMCAFMCKCEGQHF